MTKTVFITGCSSGIGRATAQLFAHNKWNVVATMRNPNSDTAKQLSSLSNVLVLPLDVTDTAAIQAAVKNTLQHFQALDVLINNAGYGLTGPLELATQQQIETQYRTNVYGPLYLMQAVLPHMRQNRSGTIINVSSVGGRLVFPFTSLYHGTKHALEAISESSAFELRPFGINVRIVEPGFVNTDFSTRSLVMTSSETVNAYDTALHNFLASATTGIEGASDPPHIAQILYQAATDKSDRIRYVAGEDAKQLLKLRASVSDEEHQTIMTERFNIPSHV